MKVLSLFDGMACGALALQAAGIEIESYDAFEIDKYAITTASHNFPFIKHHGDVFKADFSQFEGVDLVCGGSPCTYWSIAQKNNRETEASGMGWELFQQYVRAIKEAKPKFFIYENNKSMSKAIRQSIDEAFGFEAVLINSALVSAQNRQRLYWVGSRNADGTYSKVNVEQPIDRGILLKDVLDDNCFVDREKAHCLKHQAGNARDYFKKHHTQIEFEPVNVTPDGKSQTLKAQYHKNSVANFCCYSSTYGASGVAEPVAINTTDNGDKARTLMAGYYKYGTATLITNDGFKGGTTAVAEPICVAQRGRYADSGKRSVKGKGPVQQFYEAREDGKTNTLTTVQKDNAVAEPVRIGALPRPNGELSTSQAMRIYSIEGKSVNITSGGGGLGGKTGLYAIPVEFDGDIPTKAVSGSDGKTYRVHEVKNGQITIKGKQYPIKLADGFYIIRKLTVTECKRLQTVPEWYEFPVSDSQAYKLLGNGWTILIIQHLLEACLSDKGEVQPKVGEQIRLF